MDSQGERIKEGRKGRSATPLLPLLGIHRRKPSQSSKFINLLSGAADQEREEGKSGLLASSQESEIKDVVNVGNCIDCYIICNDFRCRQQRRWRLANSCPRHSCPVVLLCRRNFGGDHHLYQHPFPRLCPHPTERPIYPQARLAFN